MTKQKLALILLFSFITITSAHAGEFRRCGEYVVQGKLEMNYIKGEAVIRIRKGTQTEYRVHMKIPDKGSTVPLYNGKMVQAAIQVNNKTDGPDVMVKELARLALLPYDGQETTDVRYIKTTPCK